MTQRTKPRGIKVATPRDGWSGEEFRRMREESGRSRDWVAGQTGRSTQSVEDYERDKVFPPHSWRDKAALALRVDRKALGAEGG